MAVCFISFLLFFLLISVIRTRQYQLKKGRSKFDQRKHSTCYRPYSSDTGAILAAGYESAAEIHREDFSLTDALNNSIIQGQQQVCNFIPTAISGIIKSTLTDKMFIIAQNCGSACTVIGKYTLSPISDSDDMVYMKQYCVFIWELSGLGELKLKHIGVTKPDSMSESVYGNAFNSAMIPAGSALNQQNCSSDRMIITDTDDCTRFIPRNDILYATSDGRNCQICCFSGRINARINISSFVEKAGGRFVLIHRCYAINLDHITLLKPYCVVMSDGSELPVPVKRYNEIKQRLTELFSNK